MIYLDYNATTPLLPEVVDAMLPFLREHFGNPSSGHILGKKTKEAIEQAREQLAKLLKANPEEIFFTSGGTEANNLAIRGVAEAQPDKRHLVTSVIEHPATTNPCRWLELHGYLISRLKVDVYGCVDLAQLEDVLTQDTALVTVMHSNNETGSLQPISSLSRLAKARSILVHTDAAQSVGKVELDVNALGIELLSIAGHKLYAPKGVGALYVRRGTKLSPFTLGAGHERGLRPGTENVASIVGLGVASEIAAGDLAEVARKVQGLREELWASLNTQIKGMALNGHPTNRLPNTLNVRFPDTSGTALLALTKDLAASTGSACHDGQESASSVILAMGVSEKEAIGSVRLTLGRYTTHDEIERVAAILVGAWRQLAGKTS
jgi:cysteine desulfurase